MRRYELMLLLRPDLEDDKLQAAVEKVTRAIVNGGGSLSKVSPWGKRRLAYDIKHHREASYFLIHFDIEPGQVREIERGMLISEEILRHLVTVLEDRGPADELAPAAAARSTGEDEAFEAGAPMSDAYDGPPLAAATAIDTLERPAADAGADAGGESNDDTSNDSSDDGGEDEVVDATTDEEPAAVDARAEKEPT